jgi:hypothetical protein
MREKEHLHSDPRRPDEHPVDKIRVVARDPFPVISLRPRCVRDSATPPSPHPVLQYAK